MRPHRGVHRRAPELGAGPFRLHLCVRRRWGTQEVSGDGWVDGWVNGWMDGWVGGWVGGWVDGWKKAGDRMSRKARTSPELESSCLAMPKSMTQKAVSARDLRMKLLGVSVSYERWGQSVSR